MNFKKNAVSYSVWMIFMMCNCVIFSFLGLLCAKAFEISQPAAALGLVAVFFGILFLIYYLTGLVTNKLWPKKVLDSKKGTIRKQLLWEGIVSIVILAAGVGIRIYMLPSAGESAAYYEAAKVSPENMNLLVPVQSSVYYYLCLLRGMFLLLGNHWIAGIWLQILLQVLSGVVFYFAVRKMGGIFAAIAVLAYIMFSPVQVMMGLQYSPQMLYQFCWAAGLLLIVFYLYKSTEGGEKESLRYGIGMWVAVLFLGIAVGFLGYVDVSGMVLLLPLLLLPMVSRSGEKTGIWVWLGRTLLGVMAAAAGFFGSIYVDGLLTSASFEGILNAWLKTFAYEFPNVVELLQNSSLEVMILLLLMAINIVSFFKRKEQEVITPWILMSFGLAVLYVFGITTDSMNNRSMLLILLSAAGAVGIKELFAGSAAQEDTESLETLPIIELDQPKEKARFIENPLPLPKKHVKKVMDYAFVPEAAQMKYDVEVADTDDFDV